MPDEDAREAAHKVGDEEPAGARRQEGEDKTEREEKENKPTPADEVVAAVLERFAGAVFHESHGQPVVYVERAAWLDVGRFLRDEQEFTQCVDVTAVDHLLDAARIDVDGVSPERFEVVANYLSHSRNRRIRVICELPASDSSVPSLTEVYPGMNFPEREVYDLFGIRFEGHPDLTRILMPDDWVGYPLRKDDAPARVPVTFKEDPGPR
jgi:NADH:ubiquinone oxidoreductase subunit C